VKFLFSLNQYNRYAAQLNPAKSGKGQNFLWIVVLVIVVGIFALPERLIEHRLIYAFAAGAMFGLNGAVFYLIWKSKRGEKQYRTDKRNQWIFETSRMTISPEGICVASQCKTITLRWSIIWHIGMTRTHAFFFETSTSAYVIPRRAFRENQQFEDFVRLAREYQQGPTATGIITSLPPESTAITPSDGL
jgi:hypothetical protein